MNDILKYLLVGAAVEAETEEAKRGSAREEARIIEAELRNAHQ